MPLLNEEDPAMLGRDSRPNEEDPYIGRRFGSRYEILSKIGEGSQARVYLARHVMIDRPVAVKFLLPVLATDQSLVGRFLNEGRAAGSLGHPNIVECLDLGFAPDGAPYLVLELLKGRTLAEEIVAAGPLSPSRAAYIGSQIASAVSAAHAGNIVHRDLKPANVLLVERNGRPDHVKVLDFGISKFTAAGSRVTTITGQPLGTPGFMAPEQIEDPQSTDNRADVYGLGATLYDMLSGLPPFAEAGFPKVLRLIVEEEPRKLAEARTDLPAGLVEIVERAMSKLPAARFQTMEDFESALSAFAEEPSRLRSIDSRGPAAVAATPFSAPASVSPISPRAPAYSPPSHMPRALPPGSPTPPFGSPTSHHVHVPHMPPIASREPAPPGDVDSQPFRPKSRKRRLAAALALLLGTGLVLFFALRPDPPEPRSSDVSSIPPGPASPPPTPAPVATVAPVAPEPTTAPVPGPNAHAMTTLEAPTKSTHAHDRVTVRAPVRPATHADGPAVPDAVNCSPPFYYEGKKKIFKTGCI